MDDPKELVRRGYDQLGETYRTYYETDKATRYEPWLADLADRLPVNGKILELGCADGVPTAQYLTQRFNYQGIDISPVQIELARRTVPGASFTVADMASLTFPAESFDGIVAFYSIIHLPVAEQPALFQAIYRWLRPGGYFLGVVGAGQWTGTESDWIRPGVTMYWSHTDSVSYRAWLAELGFSVLTTYFVAEGNGGHSFFLLRKPVVA